MLNDINSFFLALVRASGRRFLLSVLVALCLLACLDLSLRLGLIALIPEKYLMRSRFDVTAHAAHAAARARHLPLEVTPVYVFGGSGMREAMTTAARFDEILSESVTGRHSAFVLAVRYNTPAQDLAVLDMISRRPGIIVYGISFTRFGFGQDRYGKQLSGRAGFGRNRVFLQYMEEHHPRRVRVSSLKTFLTAHTYLIPTARLFAEQTRNLFAPLEYQQHRYQHRRPKSRFERQLAKWQEDLRGDVPRFFDLNMGLLALFIRTAQDQGHRVLVVEQPIDHEHLAGRLDATLAYYRPRLGKLVVESGARYADFEEGLGIGTELFGDLQHLWSGEARGGFTERIAVEIQALLADDR